MSRTRSTLSLLVLSLVFVVAACGDDEGGSPTEEAAPGDTAGALGAPVAETQNLSIHNPFVPQPPADVAALYFTMVDRDGEGDRLLGVTTSVAAMTHLHFTVTEGDTTRMLPVEGGIVLPPQGMTELEPGGLHVMLMALSDPLEVGDTIEVTLQFERAGAIPIQVPIRPFTEAE